MKYNILVSIFIVFTIFTGGILPNVTISAKEDIVLFDDGAGKGSENKKETHIIEGIPYVSQETDFYCTYACPAMIFKYYGINTSLYEILFNSGVGYSLAYSHPKLKRFLLSCTGTSNWDSDRSFLASLYGLSYEENRSSSNALSEEEHWNKYWTKVKKNISNDIPVITVTDPVYLTSIRNCLKEELNIPEWIWSNTPEFIWGMFPCTMSHMIVIVGFNESDGAICFNDPSTAIFGHPEYGLYAWMNLTDFRESMDRFSKNQPYYSYVTGTYKNISKKPLEKTSRFIKARQRNIERMYGNISTYDDYIVEKWNCSNLGINALKELEKNLGNGIKNRITTIFTYKIISAAYMFSLAYKIYYLFDKFLPFVVDLSDYQSQMNYCYQLAVEKQDISQYLWGIQYVFNDSNISKTCRRDAILLGYEAENFTRLALNFSKFLEMGMLMPLPCAFSITENMADITGNMISIERKIIGGVN